MEKYKGLPLRLSELGLARITRQTGYAVHFEIMQRYYVLKQDDRPEDSFSLYLKPLDGGRGHWKHVITSWGRMPLPKYSGKRMVYSQADVRSWMLSLAGEGIVSLINDDNRPMHRDELLGCLPAEDIIPLFGIRLSREPECTVCPKKTACPVARFGLRVESCEYRFRRF